MLYVITSIFKTRIAKLLKFNSYVGFFIQEGHSRAGHLCTQSASTLFELLNYWTIVLLGLLMQLVKLSVKYIVTVDWESEHSQFCGIKRRPSFLLIDIRKNMRRIKL